MDYYKRITDPKIEEYLTLFGGVLIEGPKWCGKTSSGKHFAKSAFDVADPDKNFQNRFLAENDPKSVLLGANPRLIDEWQEVPAIWDAVKHAADQTGKTGLYLLTGSSTPRDQMTIHSGAGRIGRIPMSTMTLKELGMSSGAFSLGHLLSNPDFKLTPAKGNLTLDDILERLSKGGWPGLIEKSLSGSLTILKEYIKTLTEEDTRRIDGVARNPAKMLNLIRSLARNSATMVSNETLRKDIASGSSEALSPNTLDDYLNVLRRLFILAEIPAWYPALKSTVRLRNSPKRMLVDPSLAVAALAATPASLKEDLKLVGNLFESLVLHDLKVYAEANSARLYHYNDNTDVEIDAVIEGENMNWGAIEVKLSYTEEENGAKNLKRLVSKLEAEKQKAPSFLAVVVGIGGVLHRREDGVYVVPFDTLGE